MTETPTDDGQSDVESEPEPEPEAESRRERLVMADVRHEPPNAGTSRTYERGNEGRDADVPSDRTGEVPEDE
jgi:hypothetical protein